MKPETAATLLDNLSDLFLALDFHHLTNESDVMAKSQLVAHTHLLAHHIRKGSVEANWGEWERPEHRKKMVNALIKSLKAAVGETE
jgi:hypothetical protein